jgi:chromosome segregation ATPase
MLRIATWCEQCEKGNASNNGAPLLSIFSSSKPRTIKQLRAALEAETARTMALSVALETERKTIKIKQGAIDAYRAEITTLNRQLRDSVKENDIRRNNETKLAKDWHDSKAVISRLEIACDRRDKTIAEKSQEIADLNKNRDALFVIIGKREKECDKLAAELADKIAENGKLHDKIAGLEAANARQYEMLNDVCPRLEAAEAQRHNARVELSTVWEKLCTLIAERDGAKAHAGKIGDRLGEARKRAQAAEDRVLKLEEMLAAEQRSHEQAGASGDAWREEAEARQRRVLELTHELILLRRTGAKTAQAIVASRAADEAKLFAAVSAPLPSVISMHNAEIIKQVAEAFAVPSLVTPGE